MTLEIEYRAKLSESEYATLAEQLSQRGQDLGPDCKHIWFYVLPDKLLKVVHNISHDTGKVVVKGNRIGSGAAFPETELPIAAADVPTALRLFEALGYADTMHDAYNERRNWRYRGVEIAMKWSQAWEHHAEFEVVLSDGAGVAEVADAQALIASVADELCVRLMTEDELTEFTSQFEAVQTA
jgi:adenylate cyclase class IV